MPSITIEDGLDPEEEPVSIPMPQGWLDLQRFVRRSEKKKKGAMAEIKESLEDVQSGLSDIMFSTREATVLLSAENSYNTATAILRTLAALED